MYALIGKNLKHSFSKEIHRALGNTNYELVNTDNLAAFLKKQEYLGINVTIPYKTEIIPYLSEIDEIAKLTNSVNTIVFEGEKTIGYNTDYYGFVEMLGFHKVNVKDKSAIILGNGSVSNTVSLALKNLGAKKIVRLCRNKRLETDYLFSAFTQFLDYQIIINTTPLGMYPNNEQEFPFSLKKFNQLEVAIDLIYNPLRTKFLLEAKDLGIRHYNGLYMLVMQAKRADELFFNRDLPLNLANKIYKKLLSHLYNLVFIGLPLSGKSKYAKLFSDNYNKQTYDTDVVFEKMLDKTISNFFETNSEAEFRMFETEIIKNVYQKQNNIISTGGGVVKTEKNIALLRQNGLLIFLDRNPEEIAQKVIHGRPLIKNSDDVYKIAKERLPLYQKAADITIVINKDTAYHMQEIKEKIYEYFNS